MFILKAFNFIKGFKFYKKASTFLENPPDVCAPARSTPRHLHRRQSHHRASPDSLFLINIYQYQYQYQYFLSIFINININIIINCYKIIISNVILIVLRIIVVPIMVTYCLSIISILHRKGSEAIFIPLKCLHFHKT